MTKLVDTIITVGILVFMWVAIYQGDWTEAIFWMLLIQLNSIHGTLRSRH